MSKVRLELCSVGRLRGEGIAEKTGRSKSGAKSDHSDPAAEASNRNELLIVTGKEMLLLIDRNVSEERQVFEYLSVTARSSLPRAFKFCSAGCAVAPLDYARIANSAV